MATREAAQDKQFVVGFSADDKFQMLGYAGTFNGHHFIGSDRRNYEGIVRVEPFDRYNPAYEELIPLADYAIARDKRRTA